MTSTQEQAQEAAAQAKDKAGEAAQQAKGRARDQVDQRSTQAGEQVSAQAADVRAVADSLRDQGKDGPAKLAEQAADRAETLGSYLQDADADRILGDLEDLGRKQPLAVIAGGLVLGFAASRFIKATSQQRATAPSPARTPTTTTSYDTTPALPRTTTGGTDAALGAPVPGVGTFDDEPRPATGTGFPDPVGTDPLLPTPQPTGGL